ncbi:MAG: patatin-like phospholipase family protein [Acidobacteriia bacterium]|nr:patatin-like phospholipase family protein [Terriglobia bacterium]
MESPTNILRKKLCPESSPALSLWEALGEEYWSLNQANPDAHYEALLAAYVNARTEMEKAKDDLATAEARGLTKPCEQARTRCEDVTEKHEQAKTNLANYLVACFHQNPRNALCFSGGGIRSASFCLGVLQALARYSVPGVKMFSEFQYLSTVSGGGYTGGWLSSWIKQENSTAAVIEKLAEVPTEKLDPEPKPLLYLRNFVSYLNPKLGLLSADSWTLVSTILRNVVLNWLVLLPMLAAVLALPRLMYAALLDGAAFGGNESVLTLLLVASGIGAAISTAYIVYDLPKAINARKTQTSYLRYCLLPVSLSSLGLTFYWAWYIGAGGQEFSSWRPVEYVVASVATGLLIALVIAYRRGVPRPWVWIILAAVSTLTAAGLAAFGGYRLAVLFLNSQHHSSDEVKLFAWLAVPGALMIIGVMQFLTVGLTSKMMEDEDREWYARSMAWLLLTVLLWASLAGIVLHATWLLDKLKLAISGPVTAALGTLASRLGSSSKTKAGPSGEQAGAASKSLWSAIPADLALKLIVPAFLVLLVISLASVNEVVSRYLAVSSWFVWWPGLHRPAGQPSFGNEGLLLLLLIIPSLIAAVFVNVNKFSLHAMYRLRLIRTFLGASNEKRRPNPFTGFDPEDNLAMSSLPAEQPMHVVNMALNLVKGDKLAWQQRKAESFTVTRLHSGSCRVGYQRSENYGRARNVKDRTLGGITLGGAITISGAAASPNMGYHSSPLVTIIMTLFNARLGVWLANPGNAGRCIWDKEGPTYAVRPFIDEAFGLTTDTNAWVYLSDGGHFENLGLYEMVLRRCRNIVVIDASADPQFNYEDMGNAIRKIRIDLGIPIEFPDQPHIPKVPGEKGPHWAVGEIQYSCVDGKVTNGTLLYIKPSINGNEPRDILAYSKLQPDFPHQSTADQWFDEPQFESYRRLGFHSVDELLEFSGEACSLSELLKKACIANGVEFKPVAGE